MTRRPPLLPEVARRWAYALADVNCWISGFRAALALGERSVDMPPGYETLRDIKRWMEDFGEEPQAERIVEAEFPEVAPAPAPPIPPTGDDVVRRVVIDLVRHSDSTAYTYTVREGARFADHLGWDEMLGLIASRFAGRSGIIMMTLAEHREAHPSMYAADKAPGKDAPPSRPSYVCTKCGGTDPKGCRREDCPIPF